MSKHDKNETANVIPPLSGSGGIPSDALAELRVLATRATPGPWVYLRGGTDLPGLKSGYAEIETRTEAPTPWGFKGIAGLRPDDSVRTSMTQGKAEVEWANAAFIAAADPGTVLGLLDEIERLSALVEPGEPEEQP